MQTYDFSLKAFLLSKNHIFTVPTYKSTELHYECSIWVANTKVFLFPNLWNIRSKCTKIL